MLLDKVGSLDYKYSLLKEEFNFNIFSLLRKKGEEVKLHSRFIAELLDPKGSHGMGEIFLRLFIDCLNLEIEPTISTETKAKYEYPIGPLSDDKTEGGRIDILVKGIGERPIIIENKIYAEDQENQLLRYSNYNPQAILIYLTIWGTKPSKTALGTLGLDKVQLISYKSEISDWLSLCIEKASKRPAARETIIQYQNLINEMSNNSTSEKEKEELYALIREEKNIFHAQKIGLM